jgi:hypothetical protein
VNVLEAVARAPSAEDRQGGDMAGLATTQATRGIDNRGLPARSSRSVDGRRVFVAIRRIGCCCGTAHIFALASAS